MATADTERVLAERRRDRDAEVWDRLPRESGRAWESFKTYRDLGLTRTFTKVEERLGTGRSTLADYSQRYSWVLRVTAWDEEQDRLDQTWMLQERRKAIVRHVRQAQGLANTWITALASLTPSDLTPGEVIRYAEIATRMEREALGLTASMNVNVTGSIDVNVKALSPEDTRLRLAMLQREIEARLEEKPDNPVVDMLVIEESAG